MTHPRTTLRQEIAQVYPALNPTSEQLDNELAHREMRMRELAAERAVRGVNQVGEYSE